MTETNEISIFDEIVNCGILEEDSVMNFGAGHESAKFLETLRDYNGSFEDGKIIAIEPSQDKIKMITKKFKNEKLSLIESSLQDFIVGQPPIVDWVVITGIFDNDTYGDQQHDFVSSVLESTLPLSNKGVIFNINQNISNDFSYAMIYFFTDFATNYQRFTVKKFNDGNYIFCIFK